MKSYVVIYLLFVFLGFAAYIVGTPVWVVTVALVACAGKLADEKRIGG